MDDAPSLELAVPPEPSREALDALAKHVTGERVTVRALWDRLRARRPELTTRPDISSDFLVDAMVEVSRTGLLEDLLFELAAQRLTDGAPFLEAAKALIGHCPLGSRPVSDADIGGGEADLLAMQLGGNPPEAAPAPQPDELALPRYQGFLPKAAEESLSGKSRAMDRLCQILVDGVFRGCGVLVNDFVVITSGHVIQPLVEPDPAGGFRAVSDALKRLELHFPRAITGRGVASPADEWLIRFSPSASCETTQPFNVYDATDISLPDGPWDVGLIRLLVPPDHVQRGAGRVNSDPPNFRFKVNLLHAPRAESRILESEGEYLGRLTSQNWLRMLHDAMTIPGSSGSPCFNSDWEVVAIHQGGASDLAAKRKVNRAIPALVWSSWIEKLEKAQPQTPVVWQSAVPAIDGAPGQPVIGRRRLQQRIHAARRADASSVDRLFVIRGAKGRGKSFSIRLLQQLRDQGQVLCVLDLQGMAGLDDTRFAALLLGAVGEAAGARDQPQLSTHDREVLNTTLPEVVARIVALAPDRQIWLAFDGYATAELIEGAGIGQFLDGLIGELERHQSLRLMLTDWSRPVPPDYAAAISDLDQEERPGVDDLIDYVVLRNFPPGMPAPPGVRDFLKALIEPRVDPILKQIANPPPDFYAQLLAAAKLETLVQG